MTATAEQRPATTSKAPRVAGALLGVLALVVLVAVPLLATLILGEAPYEAIARVYPSTTIAVATTLLKVMVNGAGLVGIGALVHLMFLRDATAKVAYDLGDEFELRVMRQAALLWMLGAAGLMLFDPMDTAGVDLPNLFMPGVLNYLQVAAYAPGALMIQFIGAMVFALGAYFARHWTGLLLPLLAAIWATLAPIVVGNTLVGPSHDLANDAAVIQAFASHALFGSLVVLALRAWRGRNLPTATMRRAWLMGAVAVPVIVVTEAIQAVVLLAGTSPFDSAAGWFMFGRWIALAVIVLAWPPTIPAVSQRLRHDHRPFALSVAAVAIAVWTGLGVSLSRVPTPQYFVDTTVSEIFMGFNVLAEPTFGVLFTHWRLNLLFLTISAAGVTAYLVGLSNLRRRGDKWPAGRTVAWLLGWLVVVVSTSSGFGKYSPPHFGIHMIVHMAMNMLAPLLLVLGGFFTLMLRASRANAKGQHNLHNWVSWFMGWKVLKVLYNPILVFAVFIMSYYGLYLTTAYEVMVRYHWAHQLMFLHFLIIGYLYYGLVIGVDRTPRPLPYLGKLGLVMAAMPFHAFFGVILMGTNNIIAEGFYRYLDLPWMDLPAAQYLGGGVAWAGGEIPALIVVVALGIQWAKQDAKEAKRIDRHTDSGLDTEYEEYNKMLERLSRRGPRPGGDA